MADLISNVADLPAATFTNNAEWNETFYVSGVEAKDLLKCRFFMQMRPQAGSPIVLLDLNSAFDGGMTLDTATNLLTVLVRKDVVQDIPAGDYVRDIVMTINSRDVVFAGRGTVAIVEGVTHLPEKLPWPE